MITYRQSQSIIDGFNAYSVIRNIGEYYPDFEHWYVNKGLQDAVTEGGVLYLAEDKDDIVGVAIGKKQEHEIKFRLLRVIPKYFNRGIGIHLTDKVLRSLDCDYPYCTVSEEMIHNYSRMFINRYDWNLSRVEKGMYRKNKLEYIFNIESKIK